MPRPPRIVVPNGVYQVTAHGNRGQLLFVDDRDYRQYVRFLRETVVGHGWLCHSYSLSSNRVQLVVQTPVPNLSEGMQRLQSRYAQWFNRRHGFAGHLFDGRFRSALLDGIELLLPAKRAAQRVWGSLLRRWGGRSLGVDVTFRLSRHDVRRPRGRLGLLLDGAARPP